MRLRMLELNVGKGRQVIKCSDYRVCEVCALESSSMIVLHIKQQQQSTSVAYYREVTRRKSLSGAVVKNIKGHLWF